MHRANKSDVIALTWESREHGTVFPQFFVARKNPVSYIENRSASVVVWAWEKAGRTVPAQAMCTDWLGRDGSMGRSYDHFSWHEKVGLYIEDCGATLHSGKITVRACGVFESSFRTYSQHVSNKIVRNRLIRHRIKFLTIRGANS